MKTEICLVILMILMSAISIYLILPEINNYSDNIEDCEFVCSHLYKVIKPDANTSYYFGNYPVDYYLSNESLIEGKLKYPYEAYSNGTPYICPCAFRVEVLEKTSKNYKLYNIKEIVYEINYSDWKRWWTN